MSAPTTPVITNFTGTENPLSEGGTWTTPIRSGKLSIRKSSDVCSAASAADTCEGYYNVATYTDVEAYFTLVGTLSTNSANSLQLWVRLTDVGTAGVDGYTLVVKYVSGANYQIEFFRINDAVFTSLGVISNTLALVTGDKVLYKVTGTGSVVTCEASVTTSGVWGRVGSVDDNSPSRLTAAGNIGIVSTDNSAGANQVDDFGGGTTTPFTGATVAWMGA